MNLPGTQLKEEKWKETVNKVNDTSKSGMSIVTH